MVDRPEIYLGYNVVRPILATPRMRFSTDWGGSNPPLSVRKILLLGGGIVVYNLTDGRNCATGTMKEKFVMQRRCLCALTAALFVLFIFVDIASAYYNPRTGRFLSRDPIAEPGHVLIRSVANSGTFLPRDPATSASVSSTRGFVMPSSEAEEPHIYRAMRNNPLTWIDPDGGMSIAIPPCDPGYPPPNPPKEKPYDCVGLACRTYTAGDNAEERLLRGFRIGSIYDIKCEPCEIKCWVWEFKEGFAQNGQLVQRKGIRLNSHIVCGQVGCKGEDPKCYNKFGTWGKLEGPADCGSFKPAEQEEVPDNPGWTFVRWDFTTYYYCGPVSAVPGLKH